MKPSDERRLEVGNYSNKIVCILACWLILRPSSQYWKLIYHIKVYDMFERGYHTSDMFHHSISVLIIANISLNCKQKLTPICFEQNGVTKIGNNQLFLRFFLILAQAFAPRLAVYEHLFSHRFSALLIRINDLKNVSGFIA